MFLLEVHQISDSGKSCSNQHVTDLVLEEIAFNGRALTAKAVSIQKTKFLSIAWATG